VLSLLGGILILFSILTIRFALDTRERAVMQSMFNRLPSPEIAAFPNATDKE
jgi:hypothetical protein